MTKALVIYGEDLNIRTITDRWLALNDPQEPILEYERLEAEKAMEGITEISLDRLANKAIEFEDILVQDIDEHDLWDCDTVNVEQYLVIGSVVQYGGSLHYQQGHGNPLKGSLDGKFTQKQDRWLDSLD